MSAESFIVYGCVSLNELSDLLQKAFPDKKVMIGKQIPSSELQKIDTRSELYLAKYAPSETERVLQLKYDAKEKEHSDAETAATKALLSIQTFHKQQQALFDEFVLLRQRYDEQKSSIVNILWSHCSKYHPDLRQIPNMEDSQSFTETENQVGEYSVGELLGEGQFATVRNCKRQGNNTDYAIKIINKDRITSFMALVRVSNEIDNLKLLTSPNIVSLSHIMHTESMLYIVTEKGGRDLFDFFDEHPDGVPEDWAKQIIVCVLKGIMFCHDQYICHRDLKPENILLTFDTTAGVCSDLKLCDFGLSTKYKPKVLLTDFCGSPGFFAPEMITQGSYFGDKADVWSTGCILLELVAGHEKFCDVWMTAYDYEVLQEKEKFTAAIHDTLDELPQLLSFTPTLNDFILKFLELRISKRPSIASLSTHPWLEGRMDETLEQRAAKLTTTNTTSGGSLTNILTSSDNGSSSYSLYNRSSPTTSGSPSQSMRSSSLSINGDTSGGAGAGTVVDRKYLETAFNNLSERERKLMEDYILQHKHDGPDDNHVQMHLPPIMPSTPSIGHAKKILRKGNELANPNFHHPPSFQQQNHNSISNNTHNSNNSNSNNNASYGQGFSDNNLNSSSSFSTSSNDSATSPFRSLSISPRGGFHSPVRQASDQQQQQQQQSSVSSLSPLQRSSASTASSSTTTTSHHLSLHDTASVARCSTSALTPLPGLTEEAVEYTARGSGGSSFNSHGSGNSHGSLVSVSAPPTSSSFNSQNHSPMAPSNSGSNNGNDGRLRVTSLPNAVAGTNNSTNPSSSADAKVGLYTSNSDKKLSPESKYSR